MELTGPVILGVLGVGAATVAALTRDSIRACLALGTVVISLSLLSLIHFHAPLAAAALLIAQAGLGVVMYRLALPEDEEQRTVPLAALATGLALAGILVVALAPTLGVAGGGNIGDGGDDSAYGTWLIAASALAALAVTVGLNALWLGRDETQP